jgi:hypothetical protein
MHRYLYFIKKNTLSLFHRKKDVPRQKSTEQIRNELTKKPQPILQSKGSEGVLVAVELLFIFSLNLVLFKRLA